MKLFTTFTFLCVLNTQAELFEKIDCGSSDMVA
jgi:hypothetical protein